MPFVHLPSATIHYQECGNGTPLLLLHGLGGSLEDWAFNVNYLSNNHHLFIFDLPGFGQSHIEGEYSIPNIAESVSQAIKALSIERMNVVGFSFGGAIALEWITNQTTYQLSIDKVILFSSQPSYKLFRLRQYIEYYCRVGLIKTLGLSGLASIIAKRLFPNPNQQELREYTEKALRSNSTTSYLSVMKALTNWSVEDKLTDVEHEILVVAAEKDYTSLDSKGYVNQIPQARLSMIKDCGHAIPLEKPELAGLLINEHLKRE